MTKKEQDRALFEVPCGMYVLTAREEGRDNGCIVNTVLQSTNTPNGLIVIVNKGTLTHDMMLHTGVFTASALDETAPRAIFQRFGMASGREKDKFADFADVRRGENGLLELTAHVKAVYSGRVDQTLDLGTHTLFAGALTHAAIADEAGRVMTYGYYREHVRAGAKKPEQKKGWVCKVCGYVYEGEELPADFICPWCKHGAADFERIV